MKYLLLAGLIGMGALVPEKKLNLQLTLPQAQMVLQALNECDCPQKTAADTRQYIVNEYNLQFPAPKPVDSTHKPTKP